ncbi:MAG: hypothetical protein KTR17_12420, partial [Cellvibrionaceae bacterium]|nr:hypothetical protein [Cellvibrionaceae bacterium]
MEPRIHKGQGCEVFGQRIAICSLFGNAGAITEEQLPCTTTASHLGAAIASYLENTENWAGLSTAATFA